ncbi:carbohydrate ABC transporter permease [Solirubrobacter sp. CPCC 204708]|uniref:Carbohydrate ABC transporter permease n=1 Tax=Solirubrobacter deserti TaxID=2282478 RepID=A0ABT4RRR1_9ACTN|nr:carbohydrate ABC transporter permease [Solirubrobacter deserti]MBE2320722.1 carbohydrate ABC transporter permease [Solirubrobacter deserti]MDA0140946.1 carbohydrate ABC transporter permease [Solirubrobacter deserti]
MRTRTLLVDLLVLAAAAAFLCPVVLLVALSFQDPAGAVSLENYTRAWEEAGLARALANSTLIALCTLVGVVVLGSLAAYGLARAARRTGYRLYLLFLVGLILPFQLALIPLYQLVADAGLLGTYTGIVAFSIGLQLPITVFLYTGFLRAQPRELADAALVDGASHLQAFVYVVFPQLWPVTGVVLVMNAVFVWNDFLTPLLYLGGSGKETVPVTLYTFVGEFGTEWGPIFAAVVLATLPVLAVIAVAAPRRRRAG